MIIELLCFDRMHNIAKKMTSPAVRETSFLCSAVRFYLLRNSLPTRQARTYASVRYCSIGMAP